MVSPGPETHIELESQANLSLVYDKLHTTLSDHVERAIAAAPAARANDTHFRQAVEEAVFDRYLTELWDVVRQNVSINGLEVGDEGDLDTEPLDESLNQKVMDFDEQVHKTVLQNVMQRKRGPVKVAGQVEKALASSRQQAADRVKATDWPDIEHFELVNATIPDGDAARQSLQDTAVVLPTLAARFARTAVRAENAAEAAEEIRKLQQGL